MNRQLVDIALKRERLLERIAAQRDQLAGNTAGVRALCAAGVAAILVPLVVSTTSHQRDNALWLAGHGAGLHLPQNELSPQTLAERLQGLTREQLKTMAERARLLARPHAAQRVADELERLVNKEAGR